jgi:hypothetical protein
MSPPAATGQKLTLKGVYENWGDSLGLRFTRYDELRKRKM